MGADHEALEKTIQECEAGTGMMPIPWREEEEEERREEEEEEENQL